ncbi:MAG TPA: type VII secretion integral membrane protein EccD [Jatrophihabitantaceae bacterium]|nr:type VII secretion integral membrane protein EccD [Jatrophihabitantaceae bacterium]
MTSIESRSYCRVVVIAPSTRVDLALPADVPIIDLLPMLLQYAGELRDDGGGQHGGWKLVRAGHGELDGGRTLRSLDVADGEVLRLAAREERDLVPVFDDIVDAIAAARRDRINARSVNPGLGAAIVVAAMAVGALTLLYRSATVVDAYIAGGVALALLGLATAVAKGTGDRILATATAASGLPFTLICGLNAVTGDFGRWGVLLGSALALVYALGAQLALGTGTVVFAGAATTALLTALSALVAGLAHVTPFQVVAGTIAVAVAALAVLPRLAVRLARLPLSTVPTSSEELQATDDLGDIDDVSARARLAGEYLTGTQIGCAVTIAFSGMLLAFQHTALTVALAATATVAMALRARSVASLGGRIALLGSAAASGVVAAAALTLAKRAGNGIALLITELVIGAFVLLLATARSRRRASPQTMRLIDFFESAVVIAVLPLAVGVMGLYSTLRHL